MDNLGRWESAEGAALLTQGLQDVDARVRTESARALRGYEKLCHFVAGAGSRTEGKYQTRSMRATAPLPVSSKRLTTLAALAWLTFATS